MFEDKSKISLIYRLVILCDPREVEHPVTWKRKKSDLVRKWESVEQDE